MKTKNKEYASFVDLAERLISVPHSEVKAKLDTEKKAKAQKKARKTKT